MASVMLENGPNPPTIHGKRSSAHLSVPLEISSKRLNTARHSSNRSPSMGSLPSTNANGKSHRPSSPTGASVQRFKAEKWFDETNRNASTLNDVPFLNNDPPFYLGKSPNSKSVRAVHSNGSNPSNPSNLGQPIVPTRSLLNRTGMSESNSEDFRSVIDDLTVQNKKLKTKLRQYEKLHCSHLQDEKLFEVRIHGLDSYHKHQLEETLKSFASTIDGDYLEKSLKHPRGDTETSYTMSEEKPAVSLGPFESHELNSTTGFQKPPSSSTSFSGIRPVDSAYASLSGQTGFSRSQLHEHNGNHHSRPSKRQDVKSFLNDIPERATSNFSQPMSGKLKSKLVVKRLEQIFTGKGEAPPRHDQIYQQQEISNLATQADDRRRGRSSVKEGSRDARILPNDTELQVESLSEANLATQQSHQNTNGEESRSRGTTQASRDGSPDQRPTRPLDLDLRRAQVSSDNIEYIRHLGLASPTAGAKPDTEEGWVYLNLLFSMAQLHTLNVTPEFIRNAIADVSAKFELSADRTKVRWRGGTDGTRLSSDTDEDSDIGNTRSADASFPVSKAGSFAALSNSVDNRQEPQTVLPPLPSESSEYLDVATKRAPIFHEISDGGVNFHYKPLFHHGVPSEEDDDSSVAPDSALSSDPMEIDTGLNSGSNNLRESEARLRRHNQENGPIIFYNKARFCTDLSGDPSGSFVDEAAYHRYTEHPVGCPPVNETTLIESSRAMSSADGEPSEDMEIDDHSFNPMRSALDLEDLKSCISEVSTTPMTMEASGLGGIQPEDNFVVKVHVRRRERRVKQLSHKSSQLPNALKAKARLIHHLVATKDLKAVQETSQIPHSHTQTAVDAEIISAIKTDMAPSTLPPPSYVCLPSSSSESSDDDEDEAASSSYANHPQRSRRSSMKGDISQHAGFIVGSSSEEVQEFPSDSEPPDSDEDSSIDLLAHARVLDPDAIAAREREFDYSASNPSYAPSAMIEGRSGPGSVTCGPSSAVGRPESDIDSMSVDGVGSDLEGSA